MKTDKNGFEYYEELPANYVKCEDINNFINIDLREQYYAITSGIKYLLFSGGKYYLRDTHSYLCDKINSIILTKLKTYIYLGLIYIELQPLYITLQTNNEIANDLFSSRFIDFISKANKENKIQVKESVRAFDFTFNYSVYIIHVFKKTGKSKIIFHQSIEGIYNRTKDDMWYVIEHISKSVTVK